ncbi:signal transduction histidine kinase [Tumebacillus sp. BK434]|uniref:two-component system sensor histidine kinase NtrB n=1 Tax=Tumebacillus sp. BK434 TaxID=2512169 RepID=UPI0010473FE9|nr:ATP-binding protein [Tumebacillus sp. BK434]TCP58244.1 signal transduction histidine kinase [Tumebacillus sp. BK434]
MVTIEKFRAYMMLHSQEFTYRWWNDRHEENQNFFYHMDDKFYETVLRQEAEELLNIVFQSFSGNNTANMIEWAKACSLKRAMQGVPVDEAVERFRMFRHTLLTYFIDYAEREHLPSRESLELAEAFNNQCELALQNYMTHYMAIKERYFSEQKRRLDTERLASIGQMAAGVAHEVRNPLTSTRGFLQLLMETQPHHFLTLAMQELDRGIMTINTMLDVAKPNKPQAPKRPVSLHYVLTSVAELFADSLYDKKFVLEVADEDVLIEGSAETLKQAFFNVIKNAVEAVKDAEEPTIILRHKREADTLVVEVEDNGEGIPEELLHLLGTPFFSRKDGGVGLGLTMVFNTMHDHYAQVEVTGKQGAGVRFRFLFPLQKPPVT